MQKPGRRRFSPSPCMEPTVETWTRFRSTWFSRYSVAWATNTAHCGVRSAAWMFGLLCVFGWKYLSEAWIELSSLEVCMMANTKSFIGGVLETIWAVGAGVLAAV